jgi:hypothetical protein
MRDGNAYPWFAGYGIVANAHVLRKRRGETVKRTVKKNVKRNVNYDVSQRGVVT